MKIFAQLSTLDIVLLASAGGAILIGCGIFFLAGLHRVPKKHAIVIEKAKEFYCVFDKGTHFLMPVVYQRAGIYCIVPQTRKYIAQNGNSLDVTYQIVDVKKYHYNFVKIDDLLLRIEKENSEINLTVLTEKFEAYGLKFISVQKSLN